MSGRLFVSYSRQNESFALLVAKHLREEGIANWIDQLDIAVGTDWKAAIERALEAARGVIAILSRPAVASDIVRYEIAYALERARPVYPILIEDCTIPQNLKSVHYVDFRRAGALERVVRDLRQDASLIGTCLRQRHLRAKQQGSLRTLSAAIREGLDVDMRRAGCTPVRTVGQGPEIRWLEAGVRPSATDEVVNGAVEALMVGPRDLPPLRYYETGSGCQDWFKDVDFSPEMVVVPAGRFAMGAGDDDLYWDKTASPRREVIVEHAFAIGRLAVTVGEFHKFVCDTGRDMRGGATVCCSFDPMDWRHEASASYLNPGFPQNDTHPVTCVSWEDAIAYARWLEAKTNWTYRLPSEAEWEYACRAGTHTLCWFGTRVSAKRANYWAEANAPDRAAFRKGTVPADSFAPNPWGLYNVHGNCSELVADGFRENYFGAPLTTMAVGGLEEGSRVVRGGNWAATMYEITAAARQYVEPEKRYSYVGFRVARDLA